MKVLIKTDTDEHPAVMAAITNAINEIREKGLSEKQALRYKGRNVWIEEYEIELPVALRQAIGSNMPCGKVSIWINEIKSGVSISGIYKEEK